MTEQPPGTQPVARHFPARNRIVSGLSRGVVVVEAAHRSGSLITARCALDQGREVLAVPGHPIDARAAGCNALIRDGATLVRNAEDVLAALGIEATAPREAQPDAAAGQTHGTAHPARAALAGASDVAYAAHPGATVGQAHGCAASPLAGQDDAARPPHAAQPNAAAGQAHGCASSPLAGQDDALRPPHAAQPGAAAGQAHGCAASPLAGQGDAVRGQGDAAVHAGPAAPRAGAGESHRPALVPPPPPPGGKAHVAAPARPNRLQGRDWGGPVALEQRLLTLLGPSPTDENVLIRTLGVAAAAVAPVILSLELDGRITRLAGGKIALAG